MGLIEKYQKAILFEEASKIAILGSNIGSAPEVYRSLLGVQDLNKTTYGFPLTQIYKAIEGEPIDIEKIGSFFKNLYRDHKVAELSISDVEGLVGFSFIEASSVAKRLKTMASSIADSANSEKIRAFLGASWVYSEDFNDTSNLDMANTTAWIDTIEGVALMPTIDGSPYVLYSDIEVSDQLVPDGGSFLGSNPLMAVDGLQDTNWRCLFSVPGTKASATFRFSFSHNLSSITLDPVGFGSLVSVECQNISGAWELSLKEVIYRKKTFLLSVGEVSSVRISFTPSDSTFPKTAGFREIIFSYSDSAREATIRTNLLKPLTYFSDVRFEVSGQIPDGSEVKPYVSTDGNSWSYVNQNEWVSISSLTNTLLSIKPTDYSGAQKVSGLFKIPVTQQVLQTTDGTLEVGGGQFEVSAYRKDWAVEGSPLRRPLPEDYKEEIIKKTWTSPGVPPVSSIDSSNTSMIIQTYGSTIYNPPYSVSRGNKIVFSRRTTAYPYEEMCFVPLIGNPTYNTMQFIYNYRFKCKFYCLEETTFDSGRYWFLQGYRNTTGAPYSVIGKSYGCFSLFINGETVIGETLPQTLYSDNTIEQNGKDGRPFTFRFKKGWNDLELLFYVLDPNGYTSDSYDVGDPYLQLNMTPSIFDPLFQRDYKISSLLGTGQIPPTTEFDLLWSLPRCPEFWSWADDRSGVLFNQNITQKVDGYFSGSMPNSTLVYRGGSLGVSASDLYLRVDTKKITSPPIIDGMKLFVR